MTEPTDAEILALNAGEIHFSESPTKYPEAGHGTQYHAGAPGVLSFARAVLAKWGTSPSGAGEPVAYLHKHKHSGMVELSLRRMADNDFNRARWECSPLYAAPATPQPTQAQAGAVDEITIITAPSGYQWIAEPGDVERFSLPGQGHKIVTYVAATGIKGGQHGADT